METIMKEILMQELTVKLHGYEKSPEHTKNFEFPNRLHGSKHNAGRFSIAELSRTPETSEEKTWVQTEVRCRMTPSGQISIQR